VSTVQQVPGLGNSSTLTNYFVEKDEPFLVVVD
jgi:hypothetical protein